MLLGDFMTLDPTTNPGGIAFILMLIGLLIGVFGLFPKDLRLSSM